MSSMLLLTCWTFKPPINAAVMGEAALRHNMTWLAMDALDSAKAMTDSLWNATAKAKLEGRLRDEHKKCPKRGCTLVRAYTLDSTK